MKIGLIGDIHGNLPAFQAVLEHATKEGVDEFWNIGDSVGYGAFPEDVVELLIEKRIQSIIGNYDQTVLKVGEQPKKWLDKKTPQKRIAFEWAYHQLSKKSLEYLQSLPEQRRILFYGQQILLTHASPDSNSEHLSPSTPEKRFEELTRVAKADLVIFGHSHVPFAHKTFDTWFINTGSIGRPDDNDPRSSYAILNLAYDRITITHYRIPYDLARAVRKIRKENLPEEFAQMTLQGVDLNTILSQREIKQTCVEEMKSLY